MQGAPLCEDCSSLTELFKYLRKKIDTSNVIFFEGVREDSRLNKLLTATGSPVFNLFHVLPYGPTYDRRLIELPEGAQFEDYLKTLSGNARNNIRRMIKTFTTMKEDTVNVSCYTEPEQTDELISILAKISRKNLST